MNSENITSIPTIQTTSPGTSTPPATLSQNQYSVEFAEMPLDDLLELRVDQMSPPQLVEYVKRMATLRSSAQTRKAQLKSDAGVEKKPKSPKAAKDQSNVDRALALLKSMGLD